MKSDNLTKEQLDILKDVYRTMRHAEIFVQTREKMHPVGQQLYQECMEKLKKSFQLDV